MKIAQSDVTFGASRFFSEEYQRSESLRVTVGGANLSDSQAAHATSGAADIVMISKQAAALQQQRSMQAQASAPACQGTTESAGDSGIGPKWEAMRRILELLTGRKIRIGELRSSGEQESAEPPVPAANNSADGAQPQPVGWGVAYDYQEQYREQEEMSFSAAGHIVTEDGQEIAFKLDLLMAREYIETTSIAVRAGDAAFVDPLVVNFAGSAAELSDMRFSFDLDVDGQSEQIPYLKPGSGYLALDRNNDGVINNGSELFGPTTGSGFAELASYDKDNNGWIDENDPVFTDLRIWMQKADGVGSLFRLDEKRIGTLLLDSARSEFSLTGDQNALLGKVARTGIYLTGDGGAGTLQALDLTG